MKIKFNPKDAQFGLRLITPVLIMLPHLFL
jgi:hypothetical protein